MQRLDAREGAMATAGGAVLPVDMPLTAAQQNISDIKGRMVSLKEKDSKIDREMKQAIAEQEALQVEIAAVEAELAAVDGQGPSFSNCG